LEESSLAQTSAFAGGSVGNHENPHFGHPVI